jgi:hypothetical protein
MVGASFEIIQALQFAPSEHEPVTDAVHGLKKLRLFRVEFDLVAQGGDGLIDCARHGSGEVPHVAQQLLAREGGGRMPVKMRKQFEFLGAQPSLAARPQDAPGATMHDGMADSKNIRQVVIAPGTRWFPIGRVKCVFHNPSSIHRSSDEVLTVSPHKLPGLCKSLAIRPVFERNRLARPIIKTIEAGFS